MSTQMASVRKWRRLARAVRAYLAPVGRPSGPIAAFDPAARGTIRSGFASSSRGSTWAGWKTFSALAATKYEALRGGPVGNITVQYRTQPEARLEFDLPAWGKLQMALAGGTQMMNALATLPGEQLQGSGRGGHSGVAATERIYGRSLVLTTDQLALFNVSDIVAVDGDYTGQTGYLGAGAPAAYLAAALDPGRTWTTSGG